MKEALFNHIQCVGIGIVCLAVLVTTCLLLVDLILLLGMITVKIVIYLVPTLILCDVIGQLFVKKIIEKE